MKTQLTKQKTKGVAPPRPDWKCRSYGHTMMLKPRDEAPKVCPKCGSIKILSFHLQTMN